LVDETTGKKNRKREREHAGPEFIGGKGNHSSGRLPRRTVSGTGRIQPIDCRKGNESPGGFQKNTPRESKTERKMGPLTWETGSTGAARGFFSEKKW